LKGKYIEEIKKISSELIEKAFPLYRQVNALRENPKDERFKIVDDIRAISNELEAEINNFETREELLAFKTKEKLLNDERLKGKI